MMYRQTLLGLALALAFVGPACADEVLARSGELTYTTAQLTDVLAIDEGVLESPLSAEEKAEVQKILIAEFQDKPAEIIRFKPVLHRNAELFRHGQAYDQAVARENYWEIVLKKAQSDRFLAAWLEIMRRHAPVLAEGDGMVVTPHELAAMVATENDVADMAGVPRRSAAERKALVEGLAARFAAMPAAEKATYAHAERRRVALLANIFSFSDLHAKAVGLVKAAVHKPEDVPQEARSLEDDGMRFVAIGQQASAQAIQMMGGMGDLNSVEGINFATRRFWGQGR